MAGPPINAVQSLSSRRCSLSIGAVAALAAVNVTLVAACLLSLRSNQSLRRIDATYQALLGPIRGVMAPTLRGTNWYGALQVVHYGLDQRPTFVYTFTEDCTPCERSWHALRSVQELAPGRIRTVYVDLSDKLTPDFLASNKIPPIWMLVAMSQQSRIAYGARVVPQSELLDRAGRVIWTQVGTFGRQAADQVLAAINKSNPKSAIDKEKP